MKRFLKWALLVIVIILVLVQIPFIYRRWQTGKLSDKIQELQAARVTREDPFYKEFKGVIHVHTSLGGHSTGGFDELIAGANENALDFVIMTEHSSNLYDTASLTLNSKYGNTTFIGGNEMETATDRFYLVPGGSEAGFMNKVETKEFIEQAHKLQKLAFVAYPEKQKTWDADFDGIEVLNLNTSAKQINPLPVLFDVIWSYGSYPDLTFAKYLTRPDANLARFDEISRTRRISMFAGLDAHSNLGFHLLGDDAGGRILNLKFDRYGTIFRLFRIHLLVERSFPGMAEKEPPVGREAIVEALKNGEYFVGFDTLGDTSGFMFETNDAGRPRVMGSETEFKPGMKLKVYVPSSARIAILRNGEKFAESTGTVGEYEVNDKGTYRAEVYVDSLGAPFDKMPWIMSNPIYIK